MINDMNMPINRMNAIVPMDDPELKHIVSAELK